ncbi:hypothetical protein HYPSUDRAFT_190337 [Hypholoma sublateritium FD-334 SS-4]|uniref:Uncharacterized protein n=1 Tax=Hypholoma sublateritium (strain FD-334 SS-4) TaxID=945553 RepID=A0A0D2PFR8_HYPSF|nr:hypothetical protein HYPSUDRAFT_190337 [Hypholoma sublateritium FD-334 SS-4]
MPSPTIIVLMTLAFINLGFPLWRIWVFKHENAETSSYKDNIRGYSFMGQDYPFYHPYLSLNPASLTLQETVHYGYNASDADAKEEWDQILFSPEGTGRIHLGPNHRTFVLTFYHQLHCIVELKEALVNRNDTYANPEHVKHCLQYLRHTLLCQGNDMLEEGDFSEHHFEADRLGSEIECYDWEGVYREVGARYLLFTEWKIRVSSL